MEWLTVLETAHLSVKKPHGTNKNQRWSSAAKQLGLSSNYSSKSVQLCNLSKDDTQVFDRGRCKNATKHSKSVTAKH